MGTLLGLGAVLAYHDHRCRVSRKGASFGTEGSYTLFPVMALSSCTAEILSVRLISQSKTVDGVRMT